MEGATLTAQSDHSLRLTGFEFWTPTGFNKPDHNLSSGLKDGSANMEVVDGNWVGGKCQATKRGHG